MQFSALCKQYWRKYQTSKTAKLLGGKKVNEPYIKKKRISPKPLMYWAQIFRENWNCYALSIFRVFILLASSDSDKHIYVNEAKSVNKDSPIIKREKHFIWAQKWIRSSSRRTLVRLMPNPTFFSNKFSDMACKLRAFVKYRSPWQRSKTNRYLFI